MTEVVVNSVESEDIDDALERLRRVLRDCAEDNCLSIAYSGGLDSRFLAFFAVRCGISVELLHASARHISATETKEAIERAAELGLAVRVVRAQMPDYAQLAAAGRDRCYVCKRSVFSSLLSQAASPLCDGSNASDKEQFRPGSRAVKELGVRTPLADAGLSKPMIRKAAALLGLSDPQQPARPCLMTRFDYADAPDERRLSLTQQAEDFLAGQEDLKAGFRLRWLGDQALLHVSSDGAPSQAALQQIRARLMRKLPRLGAVRVEVLETLSGWFDRNRGA